MLKLLLILTILSLFAYKLFNISTLDLLLHSYYKLLPLAGPTICIILGGAGSARGIVTISNTVAGTSIKATRRGSKNIIGYILCEACFIYALIMSLLLAYSIPESKTENYIGSLHVLLAAGAITGACSYYSAVATGTICAGITMMEAKDPTAFKKLFMMELLSSSISIFGFVVGFLLKDRVDDLG